MRRAVLIPSLLVSLSPLAAQDLVGVSWSGKAYSIDSYAGVATQIGTGLLRPNASAVDASGTYWSTRRTGPSSGPHFFSLTTVDPIAGTATVVHGNAPDIRALADAAPSGHSSSLWCIVNTTSPTSIDELYRVDTRTGRFSPVGPTGFVTVQALAWHGGTLFAWDNADGLLTVDTRTGVARDVNPAVGGVAGNTAAIQFLCSRSDGKLIGGADDLFEIDTVSGVAQQYVSLGTIDLRGADEWYGSAHNFGRGCNGTGGQVSLSITGTLAPRGRFVSTSNNHESGALGALVLGFSRTSHQGHRLPLNLDPILGTRNCSLLVSIDAAVLGFAQVARPAYLTVQIPLLPGAAGVVVHVQHAAFEPAVPGGISWSDAATVHIGY